MPYERGDVVVLMVTYTTGVSGKKRPALVVSSRAFHRGRQEAIVAAITSNVQRLLIGDHTIERWQEAGLVKPSVATALVRTVKQVDIKKKIGRLEPRDLEGVDKGLRAALGLSGSL